MLRDCRIKRWYGAGLEGSAMNITLTFINPPCLVGFDRLINTRRIEQSCKIMSLVDGFGVVVVGLMIDNKTLCGVFIG